VIAACEIAAAVQNGRLHAADVTQQTLDAAHASHQRLNAFVEFLGEAAMRRAREIDDMPANQRSRLPLAGVPIAIKDNICLGPDLDEPGDGRGFGGRTTCASRILANYRSPFTATAAQRLIQAGAIVIGKTNMDEFGMGSSTEHSIFGPTRHPNDPTRVAGGSSGGSAAAVAAGIVPLALGSDTGGSVRQPAAWCGILGMKPTYGRLSRYGLVAYASSLDQIGVLARDRRDLALAFDIMAGHDPMDSTSESRHWPPLSTVEPGLRGLRIGVPSQAWSEGNHAEVRRLFAQWIDRAKASGAEMVEIELTTLSSAVAAYYVIAPAEASSNLARFDGLRYGRRAVLQPGEGLMELYTKSRGEGFGAEVKRRIMLGTHVLSSGYHDAYYNTAREARRCVVADYDNAFSRCDVIATPTAPAMPFRIGEKVDDPLAMYLEDVYTVGVNLAGLPAISVPAGQAAPDCGGLPVGVQVVAPAFEEQRLMRVV
jgi:aspartyl-tRNA(Asn)/glutamyl-tRNA(Gln) amidotransferase subunit A